MVKKEIYSKIMNKNNEWHYLVYNYKKIYFSSALTFKEAYKNFLELEK